MDCHLHLGNNVVPVHSAKDQNIFLILGRIALSYTENYYTKGAFIYMGAHLV